MKLVITAGMIFSLGASVSAQQVTLLGGGDEYGRESQSVNSAAIPPVPDSEAGPAVTEPPAKAEAAKSTAAVSAVKKDTKNKKILNPVAGKKVSRISNTPVKSQEAQPAVKPEAGKSISTTAAVAASTVVKTAVPNAAPGVIVIRPSEEMKTAATASAKPVEPKPAAELKKVSPSAKPSAAVSAKLVEDVKPLVQAAPAVKVSQPKAETKKEVVPLVAGPKGGFAVAKKHTVVKGETLWDLSNKYYKDPFKWGKIYTGNLDKIADPDHLYPRDEIDIPEMSEIVNPIPKPEAVTDMDAPGSEEGVASPDEKAGLATGSGSTGSSPAGSRKSKDGLLSKATLGDLYAGDLSEEMPEDLKEWADDIKIAPDSWVADGVITGVIKSESDTMSGSLTINGEMVRIKANKTGVLKSGDIITAYMKGSIAMDKNGKELGRELQKTGMLEVVGVEGSIVKARIIEAITSVNSGQVIVK